MSASTFYTADLEPVDGLTLRDARPFRAGETSVARTLPFPPPPMACWAAVNRLFPPSARGRQLRARGFAIVMGRDETERELYPQPLDLLIEKGTSGTRTWRYLRPRQVQEGVFEPVVGELPWGHVAGDVEAAGFLDAQQFKAYLLGENGATAPVTPTDLRRTSVRVGVALTGRRARAGHLYSEQVDYLDTDRRVRFRLGLELRAVVQNVPATGIVPLGGEARLARVTLTPHQKVWTGGFEQLESDIRQAIEQEDVRDGVARLKLSLLTPAIVSADLRALQRRAAPPFRTPAWRPFYLKPDGWHQPPFLQQANVRLLGAIVDKPYPLGFWDSRPTFNDRGAPADWRIEERREAGPGAPRPLYRCLPAGGVFYLELRPSRGTDLQKALDEFFKVFWFRTLLLRATAEATPTWFGRVGFGTVVIGRWPRD